MKLECREYMDEIRMDDEQKRLVGHAAVFDQITDLVSYEEKIAPGAFAKTLKTADVRLLINHDGLPLARTKSGTLHLEEDDIGLYFRAEVEPNDPDVQRLLPKLRRKDVNQMSFRFYAVKDRWERGNDNRKDLRILEELELYDISIVTFPAYPQTNVNVRSTQEIYDTYVASLRAQGDPGGQGDAFEIERQRALAARTRQIQLWRLQCGK